MTPIDFKGRNVIYAENQPEYQQLPAMQMADGEVISCWQFSDEEWERMSVNRCLFISQLCFTYKDSEGIVRINPLQPILPMAELGDNISFT